MWIRSDAAFESIVPADLFTRAQTIIRERSRKYTNDELPDQLRRLLERAGRLSGLLIEWADPSERFVGAGSISIVDSRVTLLRCEPRHILNRSAKTS
jgi:hypothetical protein